MFPNALNKQTQEQEVPVSSLYLQTKYWSPSSWCQTYVLFDISEHSGFSIVHLWATGTVRGPVISEVTA